MIAIDTLKMTRVVIGVMVGLLLTAGVAAADEQPVLYNAYSFDNGTADIFGSDGSHTTVYARPGVSQFFTWDRNGVGRSGTVYDAGAAVREFDRDAVRPERVPPQTVELPTYAPERRDP